MVGGVETSNLKDVAPSTTDATVRLRTEIYDAIAASKGHSTAESQATWHGLARSAMYNLRGGQTVPRLDTAMRIAADCGVAVEVIWERVA